MESEFIQLEREMKEITTNEQTLKKQELELTELKCILTKTAVFFDEAEAAQGAVRGSDGRYVPQSALFVSVCQRLRI